MRAQRAVRARDDDAAAAGRVGGDFEVGGREAGGGAGGPEGRGGGVGADGADVED